MFKTKIKQIFKKKNENQAQLPPKMSPETFQADTDIPVKVKGKNNFIRANLSKINLHGRQNFEFMGDNNEIIIEDTANLTNCTIKFSANANNSKIVISKECRVSLNVSIEGSDNLIFIGEKTTMARVLMVCQEANSQITIGKDCMFSHEIFIRTSDSHSIIDLSTDRRINPAKNVVIGDHVWVGQSAKLNKGVTIADNSIIANGSIVTGSVPANSAFGGNPARLIKTGVAWKRELV